MDKEIKCPSGQHIRLDGKKPKCNCWKKETDEAKLYQKAKKDFKRIISNSSKKEIKDAMSGYGISASKFAMNYVDISKKKIQDLEGQNELYKKIYNIYFNYFSKLVV